MDAKIRAAILLRQQDGKAVPEIAAQLGVHVRTVRKWFQRHRAEIAADDLDPDQLGPLAASTNELLDQLRQACALEAAALLKTMETKPTGNTTAIWRLTKSLDLLARLELSRPTPPRSLDEIRETLAKRFLALGQGAPADEPPASDPQDPGPPKPEP